jgi:hypothetical protein
VTRGFTRTIGGKNFRVTFAATTEFTDSSKEYKSFFMIKDRSVSMTNANTEEKRKTPRSVVIPKTLR